MKKFTNNESVGFENLITLLAQQHNLVQSPLIDTQNTTVLLQILAKLGQLEGNVLAKLDNIIEISDKLAKIILIISKDTLNIEECEVYTGISTSTFHKLTSNKEIEFSKPTKQIQIKKETLNNFLNSNKNKRAV